MSTETQVWLDEQYTLWRNRQKRGQDSVVAFSRWIGVSRNTINNWLLRGQTPDDASLALIAARLGPEIYDVAGKPRPDPLLQLVIEKWGLLTDADREGIAQQVQMAEARGAITGAGSGGLAPPKRRRKAGH